MSHPLAIIGWAMFPQLTASINYKIYTSNKTLSFPRYRVRCEFLPLPLTADSSLFADLLVSHSTLSQVSPWPWISSCMWCGINGLDQKAFLAHEFPKSHFSSIKFVYNKQSQAGSHLLSNLFHLLMLKTIIISYLNPIITVFVHIFVGWIPHYNDILFFSPNFSILDRINIFLFFYVLHISLFLC